MEDLEFYKMSGHGNDFILVDNRDRRISPAQMPDMAKNLCRRQLGIGADGMVFIETGSPGVDFAWRFFNADGSEAEMCGNASRCVARLAYLKGITGGRMAFQTLAGIIRAEVGPDTVKTRVTDPGDPALNYTLNLDGKPLTLSSVNTGVPHAVIWVSDIESAPVRELGRALRFHPDFAPAGTNVNFARVIDRTRLANRTYERGVEDETLACGTGCIAAVLIAAAENRVDSPTKVATRMGEDLVVYFTRTENGFRDICLEGPVRLICSGRLGPDALK